MQKNLFFYLVLFLQTAHAATNITVLAENGGHRAVTPSLLEGFRLLNISYNFNPKVINSDVVIVLAGVDLLRKAITLKRNGSIKKIIAGPNLVNFPTDHQSLVASPEIDAYIVPSEWIQTVYEEDAPSLKGRMHLWFAGVDHIYWQPTKQLKNNVLIYWKTESKQFYQQVENIVKKRSLNPVTVQYGHYTKDTYKNLLNSALCAIFISVSETQGLALAEAWSMNVPTLVWNPKKLTAYGRVYPIVSSAPYLTKQTGIFWEQLDELDKLLENFQTISKEFSPREWIINNLTHSHSAQRMLEIIKT